MFLKYKKKNPFSNKMSLKICEMLQVRRNLQGKKHCLRSSRGLIDETNEVNAYTNAAAS